MYARRRTNLCQFPEHEKLNRSQAWQVRAIDLLARHVGVQILIDGVPYGAPMEIEQSIHNPLESHQSHQGV